MKHQSDKSVFISYFIKLRLLFLLAPAGFLFFCFFVFWNNLSSAQTMPSGDAIAIRVIPNPEHYSPMRWFKNQGWTGSPQSITVDGYEAIRDGRTVYVNAANIVNGVLYTNIYLISYNQNSEKETSDIFGRLLKNWKFNTNIAGVGNCSNSKVETNCANTVGCWPFNGDFLDYSSNKFVSSENGGVSFADGIAGKAASFDGVDDWILLDGFNNGKYFYKSNSKESFSAWIKSTGGYIYSEASNQIPPPWAFIRAGGGGRLNLQFYTSSWQGADGNSSAVVFDNKWRHVVITDDSKEVKIYIDGALDKSFLNDRSALPGSWGAISMAAFGAQRRASTYPSFKGLLDEVKIYDYVLSPEDVSNEFKGLSKRCLNDSECPGGEYCSSNKAGIARDTVRLSRLVELNIALNEYKNKKGYYPKLDQGTYLPNSTISTWPSWQGRLGKELGISMPVDPVNKTGACTGYDSQTCWNKDSKKFADSDPVDPSLNPPVNSDVFVYSALANGTGYNVCALMESGFVTGTSTGACTGSAGMVYAGATANNPPKFIGSNLAGNSGEPFNGYLAATDADGDFITWTINTAVTPNWNQWSAAPTPQNTAVANQIKLNSAYAGRAGNYTVAVTIDDGRGQSNSIVTKNYNINIVNIPPIIIANNYTYTASSTVPINYKLTASDSATNYPMSYVLIPKTIDIVGLNDTFNLINTASASFYEFNRYNPPTPWANTFNSLSALNPFTYTIAVGDLFGATSTKNFTITVVNKAPQLTIPASCGNDARINNPYACQPSTIDPENNAYTYSWGAPPPAGLAIDPNTGLINGAPVAQNTYNLIVAVTDEYNFITQKNYSLKVNTYCGDGVAQAPNTEGRGGPGNNGQEDCDGTSGVAATPAASSPTVAYACTTPVGSECAPSPANCAGTCEYIFDPYIGGYCGDGVVQDGTMGTSNFGEQCDPGETVAAYQLRTGIIVDAPTWIALQSACDKCILSCQGLPQTPLLGRGCYLDNNPANGTVDATDCQKGKYICQLNNVICGDVFSTPVWDYCCRKLSMGQAINPAVDFAGISRIFPSTTNIINPNYMISPNDFIIGGLQWYGYYTDVNNCPGGTYCYQSSRYYTCDQVCQNRGLVCVGVGLSNPQVDNCVYVTHDIGAACDNTYNQTQVDCKKTFGYYDPSSGADCTENGYSYWIGTTACYCN